MYHSTVVDVAQAGEQVENDKGSVSGCYSLHAEATLYKTENTCKCH